MHGVGGLFLVQQSGDQRHRQDLRPRHGRVVFDHRGRGFGRHRCSRPASFWPLNPCTHGSFCSTNQLHGFVVLGSVVLCITGCEALYADLGHFGPRAIRMTWLGLACPALLLNYFGQCALLLDQPDASFHPFYGLNPPPALLPHGGPLHHRRRNRLPGPDFGRLLPHPAGRPTGHLPARSHCPHLRRCKGTDLYPQYQLRPHARLHHSGSLF